MGSSKSDEVTLRWGLRTAIDQLDSRGRRRLIASTIGLSLVSGLDLLGVTLLASVGVVVVSLFYPEAPSSGLLGGFVERFGESTSSLVFVAVVAVSALVLKSVLSWLIYRRVLVFLANEQAQFARGLFTRYMKAPLALTQPMSLGAVVNAIISGARAMGQLLLNGATLIADLVLVVSLAGLLVLASPLLLAFSLVYFGTIGLFLSRIVGRSTHAAARLSADADVDLSSSVIQACGLAREIRVYDMLEGRAVDVEHHHRTAALAQARMLALAQLPRYTLEVALIVGIAAAGALVVLTQDPEQAAFSIGLFTVAASRLIPAVQRVNGAWAQSQRSLGQMTLAKPVLALERGEGHGNALWASTAVPSAPLRSDDGDLALTDTNPGSGNALVLDSVTFRYPGSSVDALKSLSIKVEMPGRVALVGPSGAGKSTLADIMLGLLSPTDGSLRVEGPAGMRELRVAFVAQEVFLSNGDIRSNVTLEPNLNDSNDTDIWEALETAQLADVVRALPEGLASQLGEKGVRLSGGQRQRLGLARALYRRPDLLILDEATSALDADTERLVTDAIRAASDSTTIVSIAHRLATVRDAHLVCYLNEGQLVDVGTFDELVRRHPNFAEAARLQGLAETDIG